MADSADFTEYTNFTDLNLVFGINFYDEDLDDRKYNSGCSRRAFSRRYNDKVVIETWIDAHDPIYRRRFHIKAGDPFDTSVQVMMGKRHGIQRPVMTTRVVEKEMLLKIIDATNNKGPYKHTVTGVIEGVYGPTKTVDVELTFMRIDGVIVISEFRMEVEKCLIDEWYVRFVRDVRQINTVPGPM